MRLAAVEPVNKVKILPVFIFSTDRNKTKEIPVICAVGLKVSICIKTACTIFSKTSLFHVFP
jgi:hypothetical protein